MSEKIQNPITWVPTTWFAMGFPFVALSSASAVMYKDLGISDTKIAFWTSLIMLPYTLNPLWGPFLEMYKTRKFFVYTTQIITGVLFGLVALSLNVNSFFSVSIAMMAILAFSGATHDTAANGVYLNEMNATQQAKYVGWQGAFYNVAKLVAGGLLVYLAGKFGKEYGVLKSWTIIMFINAAIMIALGLYNKMAIPSGVAATTVGSTKEAFATLKDVIVTFFQKKYIWFGLAFIVLYRFAEGQAIKITPLFLKATREQGGLGLDNESIGLLNGVFGAGSFVLGTIASGYFVSKRGLSRKTLLLLCAIFNIPFAAYTFLAVALPTKLWVIASAISFEYFGYGFGFVGLILFIMQQIAPGKYKMAHYAFASGLMTLGFMFPSMISGIVSDHLGYKDFFIWVLISTIPSFIVTWLVPLKPIEEESVTV